VVSLWLASRSGKTRLVAYISKTVITDVRTDARPEYITAAITNTGTATLYIPLSFMLWTRPYRRNSGWGLGFPLEYWATDPKIPQRKYPREILPKASEQIMICDIATFRQTMRECLKSQSWLGRFIFKFARITIQATDGSSFRAKISTEIWTELSKLQKQIQ
jgi:hypothetical protein